MNAITIYFPTSVRIPRQNIFRRIIAFLTENLYNLSASQKARRAEYEDTLRLYGSMIDRICFGYAGKASDFDDLKQDVLMNIWISIPKFKGECTMKSWVYRLALNVCVSTLRKSYRRISTVQLEELYDIVDCGPEQKDVIAEVHEAIALLNPLDKAIMLLWLEEESYDDISEITGLSRANVATRIHRAKKRLKSLIEQ